MFSLPDLIIGSVGVGATKAEAFTAAVAVGDGDDAMMVLLL